MLNDEGRLFEVFFRADAFQEVRCDAVDVGAGEPKSDAENCEVHGAMFGTAEVAIHGKSTSGGGNRRAVVADDSDVTKFSPAGC
jgi:hypothetical protein